jgi:hypothetical protein
MARQGSQQAPGAVCLHDQEPDSVQRLGCVHVHRTDTGTTPQSVPGLPEFCLPLLQPLQQLLPACILLAETTQITRQHT